VVERAVEVADDGAGFADGLALHRLVALGKKRLGATDAFAGPFEQQGHQLVRIGIHNLGGHADLAVLLGVVAAGTVHGESLLGPVRRAVRAASAMMGWYPCIGRHGRLLE